MDNVEEFKAEMTSALPPGSPKTKVESYLNGLNLEHSYVEEEKQFYAIAPKIGEYQADKESGMSELNGIPLIYDISLLIRIKLDDSEKVENITYDLEYTGL